MQGGYQLHLVELATAEDRPITDVGPPPADLGPETTVWSPDSRFLFYVDRDSHLRALDVDTRDTRTLLPPSSSSTSSGPGPRRRSKVAEDYRSETHSPAASS